MNTNPLIQLGNLGQSLWLDYISRTLLSTGELKKLIEEDGLQGVTSNPAIFEASINSGDTYNTIIKSLAAEGHDAFGIYDAISQDDVVMAADELRPVYEQTKHCNGYVSLEVNPHLAYDTKGTIVEARRLWVALNRPNIFIKVPATPEGIAALSQLTSEGININCTLLFGLSRYRQVAEAYISGLELRFKEGKDISQVTSVASFFISRIDSYADPLLESIITDGNENAVLAQQMVGKVAIASAKMAYHIFKKIYTTSRFLKLDTHGATIQRLLWASTATKNSHYSDVKYLEALIAPNTVTTVPRVTLDAYRDHGIPLIRIEDNVDEAESILNKLIEVDIDADTLCQTLENEGIEKFIASYDELLNRLHIATS